MDNLINYIKEGFIDEMLDKINNEIITESLNAKVLQELAKQLIDQVNQEKKEKEKDSYKSIYNHTFKNVFGESHIVWDKISDSDIQEIEPQSWDVKKTKIANEKLIRSVIKGDKNSIIFSRDPETKQFEYVILTWGQVYTLKPLWGQAAGRRLGSGYGRHFKDLTQREKIDLFQNKIVYVIDKVQFDSTKIKTDRYNNRQGMINFDKYSLSKIAQDNKDRYKKIISQNKAKNASNDQLLEETTEIINKITEITVKVAKNPIKYLDIYYDVQSLSKLVYDEKKYVEPTRYNKKGYYTGLNGLLRLVAKYIEAVKDSKAGYSWGTQQMDNTVKEIKERIQKAKELIDKIEELM